MRNKIILLLTFLFFILLSVYSLHIPFFWDGTFFSELAVRFYENGFNGFIAPKQVDTGGFPLYSVYLTIAWKIFGKTLSVSHLAMLPFLIGIAYEYFKLAKRFLSESMLPFAMFMLFLEPTFITQSILMGYDILMIYFFFLSLNALLENKKILYPICLILLCSSNVRGMMLGISLFLIDIIIAYSTTKKLNLKFGKYIPVIIIVAIWIIYHQQKTGWFFFSPERENTHEAVLPANMMLRQIIFIAWKTVDFGRIGLWLFLLIGSIFFYKKQKDSKFKTLIWIIFIPLLILSLFMIPIANPIGHKYFIVIFLCLNIGLCYLLQQIKNKIFQIGFLFIFSISLIAGNFWVYPERYGNGWDSSLKVLPYFQLKEEMDAFIKDKKIDPKEIGTQFPLIADKRFSHLSDLSYFYNNVWSGPIGNYNYFLYTNVINTDIPDQIEDVKKNWVLVKKLESGSVYMELYSKKD